MHVELAKTGVKHLHHKALNFDIGIYFEANGHGTAMFMPSFYNKIESLAPPPPPVQRLLACAKCINQAVGDALSDLVFALAALQYLKWETRCERVRTYQFCILHLEQLSNDAVRVLMGEQRLGGDV